MPQIYDSVSGTHMGDPCTFLKHLVAYTLCSVSCGIAIDARPSSVSRNILNGVIWPGHVPGTVILHAYCAMLA